jgi:excisionase family DNA binding protein
MSTAIGPIRAQTPRLTYTVDEVAALFGCGRNQAYTAVHRGDFGPAIRIGRRIVVPKASVDRMLGVEK